MNSGARTEVEVGGGVEVSVVCWGLDGLLTPVLLVHGLASNARMWDGVAGALAAAGHPAVAVDQRGHGQSSKPEFGFDFPTLNADLLRVLEVLGWSDRRPMVAGQSWGGNVVLDLAAHHPESVSGVTLVDGGTIELSGRFADWPTCEAALAPPHLAGTGAEEFEKAVRAHHADWPESGILGSLANVEVLPDGTIRPWLSRDNHMRILREFWQHRPSDLYPKVRCGVLMLMAHDPANQRWMAGKRDEVGRASRLLPSSVTHWIEGDHDLHAQFPDEVARLIHGAAEGNRLEEAG